MGAKKWQKLERIACRLPLIPDYLWMAGSNNVPFSGSHNKCSVRIFVSLANIVGRRRRGATEHASRCGGVTRAAAPYDVGQDAAVHSPYFRSLFR
jgi:hypothetical protein